MLICMVTSSLVTQTAKLAMFFLAIHASPAGAIQNEFLVESVVGPAIVGPSSFLGYCNLKASVKSASAATVALKLSQVCYIYLTIIFPSCICFGVEKLLFKLLGALFSESIVFSEPVGIVLIMLLLTASISTSSTSSYKRL